MVADLADIFDERMIHQRANEFIIIVLVGPIDLRGDLERDAASDRDLDGAIDPLFGRNAAQHGEVARGHRPRRQQFFRQAVVDGADPVGLRHRTPLRVGNRNHRDR